MSNYQVFAVTADVSRSTHELVFGTPARRPLSQIAGRFFEVLNTDWLREQFTFKQAAEYLDACADHIEKHGWVQGLLELQSGAVCARGAELAVLRNDQPTREAYVLSVYAFAAKIYNETGLSVEGWNDSDTRHAEEVIAAFRAVAQDLRERQDG